MKRLPYFLITILILTACRGETQLPATPVQDPPPPSATNTLTPEPTLEPTQIPEAECQLPALSDSLGEVTVYDPAQAYDGLTLFVPRSRNAVEIVTMTGRLVAEIPLPESEAYPNIGVIKPLEGPRIAMIASRAPDDTEYLRPGHIVEIDTQGQVLWSWQTEDKLFYHHDLIRNDDGSMFVITAPVNPVVFPLISPLPITNDTYYEVAPDGRIVWSWSVLEHFDQMPYTENQRDQIEHWDGRFEFRTHTNSLQVLPPNQYEAEHPEFSAGNILVSLRAFSKVFIIDKDSGEIVWVLDSNQIGQHQVRMIPEGLPGAGNLLVFDNGIEGRVGPNDRGRNWSRVLEINPVTQEIVWSYDARMSGRGAPDFFAESRGGQQRLPNGNTLIAEAPLDRIFEVTPSGEIVWEYTFENEGGFYRAYRVDPAWWCGAPPGGAYPFPW